jgi:hypothetical protein
VSAKSKDQAETPTIEETTQRVAHLLAAGEKRLRAMAPSTGQAAAGDDLWSSHERLGHLIDAATNHHQHLVRAQLDELLAFPALESGPSVSVQPFNDVPWDELVNWWVLVNRHILRLLNLVPPAKYGMPCLIGRMKPVPLERLCAEYAKSLNRHLKQLCGADLE